ncbi:MAG: TspO/MBR family protein [Microgenomates group bacterium]
MKDPKKFFASIIICQLTGLLGTPFTRDTIPNWYQYLNKPFFAPPNWVFGPVWTILYFLMGVSLYLVWQQGISKKENQTALKYFAAQLGLNFLWSPIFFGLRSPGLGLIVILAMWVMIVMTIKKFYPLSKWAAYLLVPYLLWVSFATLLNAGILILN